EPVHRGLSCTSSTSGGDGRGVPEVRTAHGLAIKPFPENILCLKVCFRRRPHGRRRINSTLLPLHGTTDHPANDFAGLAQEFCVQVPFDLTWRVPDRAAR